MYLGIEIGGTKLQLGIGPGDGTIAALWRGVVVPADGADGIRKQIEGAVSELLANAKRGREEFKGVGIGFGGPVDDATRTVIKSHQIAGWDGFPLAAWIEEITGLPAVLGNDADVAGLAEALFGAGKGLSPIFYITIGSGIGGGLIINGEIYRGCGRGAAEIGHLDFHVKLTEGASTSMKVEDLASGWAIDRFARTEADLPGNENSPLLTLVQRNTEEITARHVAEAAAQGDRLAKSILARPRIILASAIAQVIVLLCPRRIILGGGVSLMGEKVLFQPLRSELGGIIARQFPAFLRCYDIVPAALGEEVVIHGALALARKRSVVS
jgi:glucokinase